MFTKVVDLDNLKNLTHKELLGLVVDTESTSRPVSWYNFFAHILQKFFCCLKKHYQWINQFLNSHSNKIEATEIKAEICCLLQVIDTVETALKSDIRECREEPSVYFIYTFINFIVFVYNSDRLFVDLDFEEGNWGIRLGDKCGIPEPRFLVDIRKCILQLVAPV